MQALDEVPYSWLLRFRTQMWYQDGIGAKPMFRPAGAQDDRGAIERMIS